MQWFRDLVCFFQLQVGASKAFSTSHVKSF